MRVRPRMARLLRPFPSLLGQYLRTALHSSGCHPLVPLPPQRQPGTGLVSALALLVPSSPSLDETSRPYTPSPHPQNPCRLLADCPPLATYLEAKGQVHTCRLSGLGRYQLHTFDRKSCHRWFLGNVSPMFTVSGNPTMAEAALHLGGPEGNRWVSWNNE